MLDRNAIRRLQIQLVNGNVVAQRQPAACVADQVSFAAEPSSAATAVGNFNPNLKRFQNGTQ